MISNLSLYVLGSSSIILFFLLELTHDHGFFIGYSCVVDCLLCVVHYLH